MVACLSVVCLICSAVLAGTYAMTVDPIAKAQQAKTDASIAKVLPVFSASPVESSIVVNGTEYRYYRAEGSGYAVISDVVGFGGPLSVMVGIEEDGTIHNTAVLSHSETPGLGAKCQTDEGFLGQFRGFSPQEKTLKVTKDGGDVDAITASTITSRAYTLAIANAVEVYKAIIMNGGESHE
mgnify:FL=1